jgi:threonine synthase
MVPPQMVGHKTGMEHVLGFKCTICGAEYGLDEIAYVCPKHGQDGIVDIMYDYELLRSRLESDARAEKEKSFQDYNSPVFSPFGKADSAGMWRYKHLLPVRSDAPVPPLRIGGTPLYAAPRLGKPFGLNALWVKDDSANPSASLKDRASAMAMVKAQEMGVEVVTTASTGNAAAALACLAASVGLRAVIFVPRTAPPAKIVQQLIYGARVLLVDGSYDDAFDLAIEASAEFGWYNRNTAFNPYMSEGKKTVAYEICEQLQWHPPDRIVIPVGDGCILGGVHKGLKDLLALGLIDRMPRLVGVQAAGSSPLVSAWEKGLQGWDMQEVPAHTRADSICAGLPRDRNKALAAVRETDGAFIAVEDQEILEAIPTIAQATGVFVEPAAAAAYAGLVQMMRRSAIHPEEHVVLLLTGSGLKDIPSAMAVVNEPPVIAPTLSAVKAELQKEW